MAISNFDIDHRCRESVVKYADVFESPGQGRFKAISLQSVAQTARNWLKTAAIELMPEPVRITGDLSAGSEHLKPSRISPRHHSPKCSF